MRYNEHSMLPEMAFKSKGFGLAPSTLEGGGVGAAGGPPAQGGGFGGQTAQQGSGVGGAPTSASPAGQSYQQLQNILGGTNTMPNVGLQQQAAQQQATAQQNWSPYQQGFGGFNPFMGGGFQSPYRSYGGGFNGFGGFGGYPQMGGFGGFGMPSYGGQMNQSYMYAEGGDVKEPSKGIDSIAPDFTRQGRVPEMSDYAAQMAAYDQALTQKLAAAPSARQAYGATDLGQGYKLNVPMTMPGSPAATAEAARIEAEKKTAEQLAWENQMLQNQMSAG